MARRPDRQPAPHQGERNGSKARSGRQHRGRGGTGASEWIVFRVTDISVPPVDLASDDAKKLKETLQRGLSDELISQYVVKLESEIGTTINEAAFAQVTGANNN